MLDALLEIVFQFVVEVLGMFIGDVFEVLLEVFVRFALWPILLLISTPLVLIYALSVTLRHHQNFFHAAYDGYSFVSAACWY